MRFPIANGIVPVIAASVTSKSVKYVKLPIELGSLPRILPPIVKGINDRETIFEVEEQVKPVQVQ